MNPRIRALLERKQKSLEAAKALSDKAVTESRDLSAEERTQFDQHLANATALQGDVEREKALIDAQRNATVTIPAGDGARVIDNRTEDPKRGFQTFGEYCRQVHRAAVNPGQGVDERLLIGASAPTTYGNESSGADGGFSIPPEFSKDIFQLSLGEDAFLPLTDNTEVTGNSMTFPKDETTPWGTDGIRVYWAAEASTVTNTKPKLGTQTLRLEKLMGLIPMTDELLADSRAMGSYVFGAAGKSVRWKTNEAIINGTGVGQPQGVMNSNAAVQVSKDVNQAANTLSALNLANMLAQLPPGSFGNAVWLMNSTVFPLLITLTLGNGVPLYVQDFTKSPYGMVLGRPLILSEHAANLTSAGDVQLHDFSYYRTLTKAGGIETATSMHLFFDADATAFRIIFRVDGRSKIAAPISKAAGSIKLSPFLKLQAR